MHAYLEPRLLAHPNFLFPTARERPPAGAQRDGSSRLQITVRVASGEKVVAVLSPQISSTLTNPAHRPAPINAPIAHGSSALPQDGPN